MLEGGTFFTVHSTSRRPAHAQTRATFGPSERRDPDFKLCRLEGGDDADTVADASFGNVPKPRRQSSWKPPPRHSPSAQFMTTSTGTSSGLTKSTTPTLNFLKSTDDDDVFYLFFISPHQVLLDRKIDAFSHKEAGDAIAAVAARFPHSDASADSDLDASR